jgi:lysophospholipase L1-like esterase
LTGNKYSFFSLIKKFLLFFIIFFIVDIVFFYFLPDDIKLKLYNNRAHRIKSYYYHHDLRPMASFYDHWGYQKYQIFTNNLGFKDKSNRKVNFKNKNILFIGDSFTEGVGLKYEDSFVGLIEENLKKNNNDVEVLNAGVQSYSTGIYLSKIFHLIERKNLPITDIVVVISGGDIYDDYYKYLEVNSKYILDHIDNKNKHVINIINFIKSNTLTYQIISRITPPKVIPELIKSYFDKKKYNINYDEKERELLLISKQEIENMKFLYRNDYAYLYSIDEFENWGKEAIKKSILNIERIYKICKKQNINLNIFYLYEPVLLLRKPNQDQFNFLINSFKNLEKKNLSVNFINDLYSEYEDSYDAYKDLFFINDIHLNKKGNSRVAKEILKKINF